MATPPAKRKIFCLNVEQKREICMYHIENPGKTQKEIAEVFSAKFGDVVGRRTIGDILANMQRWMIEVTHSGSAKRLRCAKYGRLEEALQLWYADARMTNPVISDSVLREKAKEIGSELGIDDPKFQYSNGWLHRFKNRCATNSFIKSYNREYIFLLSFMCVISLYFQGVRDFFSLGKVPDFTNFYYYYFV
ncbi:tigger transposable element-derived protein 4 [Biomphalaria pfeifferi]|uniref:Tigger transposable element-derived protein 4 n=1 Tax=Biomphalaria pfeifferi TaxID=112525 RepID=A0AAD8FI28_BIOPF|nr:tigger transposable element-derived protein 4 [Biomphalaria pfeifferi]